MTQTITAEKYAELTNSSLKDVIAQIKSGELKGSEQGFAWYVEDVDLESLSEASTSDAEAAQDTTGPAMSETEDSEPDSWWWRHRYLVGVIAVLAALGAIVGEPEGNGTRSSYIEKDAIICHTESLFDRQMAVLSSGSRNVISGCQVTSSRLKGSIGDISLMSGKTSVILSNGQEVWTQTEMVD